MASNQDATQGEKGRPAGREPDSTASNNSGETTQGDSRGGEDKGGHVALPADLSADPAGEPRVRVSESRSQASNRWVRAGISLEVEAYREQVRAECSAAGLSRPVARDQAWIRAIEAYPAPGIEPVEESVEPPVEPIQPPPEADSGRVLGLGDIPAAWPVLPPNASLQAEVSWVQASRVDVVEYLPTGGTRVNLARADQPAPSKAALSWLETAVLFPSKFADVSVKATQGQADDAEAVRREKLSINEVRGLLAEMVGG